MTGESCIISLKIHLPPGVTETLRIWSEVAWLEPVDNIPADIYDYREKVCVCVCVSPFAHERRSKGHKMMMIRFSNFLHWFSWEPAVLRTSFTHSCQQSLSSRAPFETALGGKENRQMTKKEKRAKEKGGRGGEKEVKVEMSLHCWGRAGILCVALSRVTGSRRPRVTEDTVYLQENLTCGGQENEWVVLKFDQLIAALLFVVVLTHQHTSYIYIGC